MKQKDGMMAVFLGAIGALGGMFKPVEVERSGKYHAGGRREMRNIHTAPQEGKAEYYQDRNGNCRRVHPKRDKSISARQWKKQVKASRRAAKLAQE